MILIKFRINKRARLWTSLAASAAFIALAIYGWELPIATAAAFLAICGFFLVAIIGLAILGGWLLRLVRQRMEDDRKSG